LDNNSSYISGLYIVATPIGNLKDITIRALEVLKAADLIACEDTRTSGKLLSFYGIKANLTSYHDHSGENKRQQIIEQLQNGKIVALISDAGTPLISDPDYKLVKAVADLGIKIFPIPGASSVVAALSVSGLPSDRFLFSGFLPNKAGARNKEITELASINSTIILFESVHRLKETLIALSEMMGEQRQAVIARELTKLYEELRRGNLQELANYYKNAAEPKGEVVIIIAPPIAKEVNKSDINQLIKESLPTMSVKDASSHIAKITGVSKQEIYNLCLIEKKAQM
jgi:16S rRNA (cytidine1402-2'-O)-methyltransferase